MGSSPHSEKNRQKHLDENEAILPALVTVLEEKQCFTLNGLAVSGKDILALGVPEGKVVGEILNRLLDAVISESAQNEKETLLQLANKIKGDIL